MIIYFQHLVVDRVYSCLLIVLMSFMNLINATSILPLNNDVDQQMRRATEYVMTSSTIDGIKRSNVCGDGYRIDGALLKSYPYSKSQSYFPNEDCYMTFQARRSDHQIRIRFLSLDLNDIHGGVNCLDSLRFYQSAYITRKEKLDTVECGQLTEEQKFNVISPTGIVTAHFSTDGGNVSGLGFKVVLTAFRSQNKTHPCEYFNDEYLCQSRECISRTLRCDGVPHCLDGSDESPHESCTSNEPSHVRVTPSKRQNWRGILIAAFLLLIFVVFVFFTIYFLCRRCFQTELSLTDGKTRNYTTILNFQKNRSKPTSQVIVRNEKKGKHLDDDYNLL